jgi:hypothetical protein
MITALVNEPANRRFATPDALTDEETRALLHRWMVCHWARVALGLAASAAALQAMR